jgi:hypothetical protein
MKIDILGTEYDFIETSDKEDDVLADKDGYTDVYSKRIVVENGYNETTRDATKNFNEFKQKVKRHECIHAIFYEAGMSAWHNDENLVDFLAIQFPKMLKAFQDADAI